MSDLNAVHLIGRLGKPPESRQAGSQTVCNFSIAVSEQYKDKTSGEKKENTNWIPIVAWGKLAEICSTYLAKGSQVAISGRLQVRKWADKDGKDRWTTEVVADKMQMIGAKPAAVEKPAAAAGGGGGADPGFDDSSDIPFIRAAGVSDRA